MTDTAQAIGCVELKFKVDPGAFVSVPVVVGSSVITSSVSRDNRLIASRMPRFLVDGVTPSTPTIAHALRRCHSASGHSASALGYHWRGRQPHPERFRITTGAIAAQEASRPV